MEGNLYNLTHPQKSIWLTEQFCANTSVNNIGGYIIINETVNFEALEKAINHYIEQNEACRIHLNVLDGVPMQYIKKYSYIPISTKLLNTLDDVKKWHDELIKVPFSVINSNLSAFHMFRLPDGRGGFNAILHHLVTDAWGMSLLINQIMDCYAKLIRKEEICYSTYNYTDFIASEQAYLDSPKFEKDKEFWNNIFDSTPEITSITSQKRDLSNIVAKREAFVLDTDIYTKISEFCKTTNCSVYTFFMAIYSIYLSKLTNCNSPIIGTPVLNRTNFKEKHTSGMFISNVPFKVTIEKNQSFQEFLKNIAVMQMSIFRHQKYPYSKLLEDLKKKYDFTENLYDTALSYQNARDNKEDCNVNYTSNWLFSGYSNDTLQIHFYDMDNTGNMNIYYDYQVSKLSQEEVQLIHERIMHIAEQVMNDSNILVKNIEIVTIKEKEKLLNDSHINDFSYDNSKTIVDIFEEQVSLNPTHSAVIFEDSILTYQELNEKANQLAHFLLQKNIKPNDVIGILLPRGVDLLISVWAILKTGAGYMLIDSALPEDRINYMLSNANSPYLITNSNIDNNFKNKLLLDTINLDEFSNDNIKISSNNEDIFCVIYTSGSTGTPKGVTLKRNGIINLVYSHQEILDTNCCENFLSTSTVAFDMFIVENFTALLSGKTVILANDEEQKIPIFMSKLIKKYHVDFILSTPSKISLLLLNEETASCLQSVKILQLGGEVFPEKLYKKLVQYAINARIFNGYGPSECSACSSIKEISPNENITIGKPFLNTNIYILNQCNNLLPIGYVGEICIAGNGVGKGYIGNSELTDKSFVKNPFGNDIMYKTGDMGKILPNGEIEYIGRQDNQVKLRGLRIELEEITNKILTIPKVKNAVTLIKKVNNIDCLCAYVSSNETIDGNDIKSVLKEKLPYYMVPSHIILMESLPLTLNGKIDVKSLPEISVSETKYIAPKTEIEIEVISILEKLLELEKISMNSNFFDLGGDSLCAIKLVNEIYTKLKVKLEVKNIFEHDTILGLCNYIDSLAQHENEILIPISNTQNSYPLSSAQNRIYYTVSIEGKDSVTYNTPGGIIFDSKPNVKRLEDCFNILIKRHSSLRTYFTIENNTAVQKIVEDFRVDFPIHQENYENLEQIFHDFIKPFDLSKLPLFRTGLIEFTNGKYMLLLDMHHIICDGTSLDILMKELCSLYNGDVLPDKQIDYKDFTLWEQEQFKTEEFEKSKEFWLNQFKDEIPLLNMPLTYTRPSTQSFEGSNYHAKLPKDIFEKINKTAKELNITPYMLMLSSYYILLSKYTSQDDIVVGTPIVGREVHELSNVLGMFVNSLALRNKVDHSLSFESFSTSVKENCLNCFKNQTYPFDVLVKDLNLKKDTSRNPLFDTMFIFQNNGYPNINFGGINTEYFIPNNNISKFDLSLEIIPENNEYSMRFEYCTKLFDEAFIKRLSSHYINILNAILENTNIKIADIDMLSKDEKYQILYEFNDTFVDYPKDKTIVDLFEEQVEKTPDNIAVVFEEQQLTYRELNEKANSLARYLIENGVSNNSIIGIMLPRSIEIMVTILGVLKAGACYIPIDPSFPEERIEYMLQNSNALMLLKTSNIKDIAFEKIVDIDLTNNYIYELKNTNLNTNIKPSDLSYIIYTSGSTGKPKGVKLKHIALSNLANYCNNYVEYLKNNEYRTIVSITTISFDIFIFETLISLQRGLKLVMANSQEQNIPNCLDDLIKKHNIEIIQTTPSRMQLFYNNINDMPHFNNLKYITLAGEQLPFSLVQSLKQSCPCQVYNGYGPSETTVFSTLTDVTNKEKITIGKPLYNTQIYILNNNLQPCPIGIPGEIYISGDGVGYGYINNDELNKSSFIKNPFNINTLMYKTGDIGYYDISGEINCLGRIDNQIKIRGLRIELEEIEKAILKIPNILNCIVEKKVDENSHEFLCAYFIKSGTINISNIRNLLQKQLPNYMVPQYFVELDYIPYTPNGKVDKKLLPFPNINEENKNVVCARNDLDTTIISCLKELLRLDNISIKDSFFDLGMDSLDAINLSIHIYNKLRINVTVQDIFNYSTVQDLSDYIATLSENATANTIKKAEKMEFYPLSSAQKRIYYTSSLDNNSTLYNVAGGIIVDNLLDIDKLNQCFATLINRHDALRSRFDIVTDEVVQIIDDNIDFKLNFEDISTDDLNKVYSAFVRPFDLSKAPLFRVKIAKLNNNKMLLLLDMHHIISDGTSLQILLQELCDLYNGYTLPEKQIDYKDFTIWEYKQFKTEEFSKSKEFWVNQFKDEIPLLNMPTTFSRPSVQSFDGSNYYTILSNEMFEKINTVSKKLNITPYMLMLSTYYILLSKYSSQDDIVVGTPIVGRELPELSNMLGMFVNTLALRNKIDYSLSFEDFSKVIKENCLNCFKNQSYPFDMLVKELNVKRDTSRSPLFDVMFIYQNNGYPKLNFNNATTEYFIPDINISKFDLSLEIIPMNNEYSMRFEYCTKLFDNAFIERLSSHYINILNAILNNTNIKIADIDMLSKDEKHKILYELNDTYIEYPSNKTIVDLFEEQVEKTPNNIAVVFEDQQLTYRELNEKANSLARYLAQNGVSNNSIIGIMLPRSIEIMVTILGVLKAGSCYIPIDPSFPKERIQYMMQNSNAFMLLKTSNVKNIEFEKMADVDLTNNSIYELKNTNLKIKIKPSDLSYVIYTSGSTGNPKGVALYHKALYNLACYLNNNVAYFKDIYANLPIASITTISFDIFLFETLISLQRGLKVIIANEKEQTNPSLLDKLIEKHDIKAIQMTPSRMDIFINNKEYMPHLHNLKYITLAGEALPYSLKQELLKLGDVTVYNGYGPSETTVFSTFTDVTNQEDITIGKPLANTYMYVLDKHNNLCPIGIPGELYISGDGVGLGYLNNKELTDKAFIPDCFNKNLIMYKTGDLVKWLPNNELHYIGRTDNQVKIRGLRIELDEIQKWISNYNNVNKVVISANKDKTGRQYIIAYLTVTNRISINNLKIFLSKHIPKYMIPTHFIILDEFPYLPNGKINKKALPLPKENLSDNKKYVAPINKLEIDIAQIFERLLSISPISTDDNFFDIGGDSLLAMSLQLELLKININVSYSDIFMYPTIKELSNHISSNSKKSINKIDTDEIYKYDTILKDTVTLPKNLKYSNPGNILLTGVTGFLGAHILDAFLQNETGNAYCLIRTEPGLTIEQKLVNKLHYYFDNKYDSLIGSRIIPIKSDIATNNLGLTEEVLEDLASKVDVVINSAAKVSHYGNYGDYKKINVDGTQNLINFCKKNNKRFYQISTLSVSGNSLIDDSYIKQSFEQDIDFTEDKFYINQALDNVYVRSKFEAERIVLNNILTGLDGYIIRVGNLMNRFSDGKFQPNVSENAYINRLITYYKLGHIPDYLLNGYLELTPIDCCANAILKILQHNSKSNRIFHLLNHKNINVFYFINTLNKFYDKVEIVNNDEFIKIIDKFLNNPNTKNILSGLINDFDENRVIVYSSPIKIKSDFTIDYLNQIGFEWPELNEEYIIKFLKFFDELNLLDRKDDI